MMKTSKKRIFGVVGVATLAVLGLASVAGYAQENIKVEGIIKARSGEKMILDSKEDPNLVVHLTESTMVDQVQGVLKIRSKIMSMAALIPGLPVKVEGFHDAHNELVATQVKFKGNDLEQARAIQAGMHETKMKTAQNEDELAKQQAQMTEEEKKTAANSARFGQLDDYYIMDEFVVLFANGSSKVDPKYNSSLEKLGQKAKDVHGYLIEVKGYASAVGSTSVNQEISEKRANSVASFMLQQCHIPLTNMLAPGAMGESGQTNTDKSVEAEAQNRRVVVRVLQNKAFAGAE